MFYFFLISFILIFAFSAYLSYKKVKSVNAPLFPQELVTLLVKVKKEDKSEQKTAPIAAERLFANLHGLLNTSSAKENEVISFEIVSTSKGIFFYVTVPREIKSFVESQIYAAYPESQITEEEDPLDTVKKLLSENYYTEAIALKLAKKDYFPIKTFNYFEVDPLSSLTETLSNVQGDEVSLIQYTVSPREDNWQKEGHLYVKKLKEGTSSEGGLFSSILDALFGGFKALLFGYSSSSASSSKDTSEKPTLTGNEELGLKAIDEKLSKMGFTVNVRILSLSKDSQKVKATLKTVAGSFKQFSQSYLNSFEIAQTLVSESAVSTLKSRVLDPRFKLVLNTEELASIFHFPSLLETPKIAVAESKKGEPPSNLPTSGDINYFGITNFRNKQVKFGIKNGQDRLRHMYFIGKTGTGKSTLFENMIVQDIKEGRGCGYLDPHGETIEKILKRIPKNRIKDVVLIDPSESSRPVGINVLECPEPSQRNLLASSVLNAFALQFGHSWGPRLEYLLNYAILTLIGIEGTTLLGITRLFSDKNYLRYILEKVDDPMIKRFWTEEFENMKQSRNLAAEAVSPIQNKVNRLLASTTIRNILGQRNSTIKFDEIMNTKKILLVNLSKGKIGDDNANLLGSLIVNRLTFYAMQRASMPEEERVPFYLFVDEFQNFASESFKIILSEARKYGLSLHLTHQYTAQLPETIKDAILGNVGSLTAFTLGAQDAKNLVSEFAPTFEEQDLISQEKYSFYCKLQIDGAISKPFSARSLPPEPIDDARDYSQDIKKYALEKYGRDKAYVEEKIRRWINRPFDVGMAVSERYNKLKKKGKTKK